MNWLSFLIGALVGWLICWLIDYLVCRRRRMAAEALLAAELEPSDEETASLRAQLASYKDVDVRLNSANLEIESLKAQLAEMKDTQADLDACRAQVEQQGLEIERLNAELVTRVSTDTAGTIAAVEDTAVRTSTLEAVVDASAPQEPEAVIAPTPLQAEPGERDDLTRIEGIGTKISALLNKNGIYTFAQLAATSVESLQSILEEAGARFNFADPRTWPEQALLARDDDWDALQALQDTLKGGRAV